MGGALITLVGALSVSALSSLEQSKDPPNQKSAYQPRPSGRIKDLIPSDRLFTVCRKLKPLIPEEIRGGLMKTIDDLVFQHSALHCVMSNYLLKTNTLEG